MVLVVVSDVQGNDVDRAIVTRRLLSDVVSVMFLDPARTDRMKPNGKEKRKD